MWEIWLFVNNHFSWMSRRVCSQAMQAVAGDCVLEKITDNYVNDCCYLKLAVNYKRLRPALAFGGVFNWKKSTELIFNEIFNQGLRELDLEFGTGFYGGHCSGRFNGCLEAAYNCKRHVPHMLAMGQLLICKYPANLVFTTKLKVLSFCRFSWRKD